MCPPEARTLMLLLYHTVDKLNSSVPFFFIPFCQLHRWLAKRHNNPSPHSGMYSCIPFQSSPTRESSIWHAFSSSSSQESHGLRRGWTQDLSTLEFPSHVRQPPSARKDLTICKFRQNLWWGRNFLAHLVGRPEHGVKKVLLFRGLFF